MKCPKCEQEILSKICFKVSGEVAYLCGQCDHFWFVDENINIYTGHTLEEAKEFEVSTDFIYLDEKDEKHEKIQDAIHRKSYETI